MNSNTKFFRLISELAIEAEKALGISKYCNCFNYIIFLGLFAEIYSVRF
jgi:hypothetical protein